MTGTQAVCGHYVTAVGAPNSTARLKCESVPCPACQAKDNANLTKWKPCPACGYVYDCTVIPPPRVPADIRCACCCQ